MAQENNSLVIDPRFHQRLGNGPASEVVWNGSFEVVDIHEFPDSLPDMRLREGFMAHPPAIVSRKSYEFSRKITGDTQFSMQPRSNSWPKGFLQDPPTVNDLALYFFPEESEGSRNKYSCLLNYMDKHDLVLSSGMGSVELLVYPSTLLPEDSQSE
ncbi:hypothetical protein Tsubulata_047965 [Turnera subulata]|uniref:AIPP2-like SPOC-like domain-containing protein n=1 Tax=Turnera subulata TaxID=218843 RepID=A0A9Q0GG15_9ROSI|nr:hypothetical protein Tsubulata_047965 [Turnera subulata]